MSISHGRIKKRIKKRHLSISSQNSFPEESQNQTQDQIEPPFHPVKELDTSQFHIFPLLSKKGHTTYYARDPITTGDYFFETEITSVDYDVASYIKTKCVDEVKKKYYEPVLKHISQYNPTVRVGLISADNDLDIPIGAIGNSYCYRSIDGALIKGGEYIFGNESFKTGDIIGCFIHLKPPKPEFLKKEEEEAMNVLEDECYVKFYLNGKEQAQKITVSEGSYYIGVTLFNFATANVNYGKNVQFFPKGEGKSLKFICEN